MEGRVGRGILPRDDPKNFLPRFSESFCFLLPERSVAVSSMMMGFVVLKSGSDADFLRAGTEEAERDVVPGVREGIFVVSEGREGDASMTMLEAGVVPGAGTAGIDGNCTPPCRALCFSGWHIVG